MRRTRAGLAALAALTLGGCAADLTDIASFVGDPFGDISDNVKDMDKEDLDALMSTLMLRFRFYIALREAIPFESFDGHDECITAVHDSGDAFDFVASVPCVFGESADPAEGEIAVTQQQLSASPNVFRFIFDYRDVVLGDLEVSGVETIRETEGSDGASVRKLDVIQDGIELQYEFRAGFLGGETPIFDYELPTPDGTVIARISNPSTSGSFVTVFLTGLDGTLHCDVRNSLWTPERLPRGTCDNGVVFGLPDEDEVE